MKGFWQNEYFPILESNLGAGNLRSTFAPANSAFRDLANFYYGHPAALASRHATFAANQNRFWFD